MVSALKAESQTLYAHADNLDLRTSGMGGIAVENCLSKLSPKNIVGLISWGVCGALTPQLKPGDLVIPKAVMNESKKTIECNNNWRNAILMSAQDSSQESDFIDSMIINSDAIVTSTDAKKKLADSSGADAVDMESYAIASFADQHAIPFVVVRAVVDKLDDALPQASSFKPGQSAVSFSTLLNSIARPLQWPVLIRTGSKFNIALRQLTMFADTSIDALSFLGKPAIARLDKHANTQNDQT